MCEKVCASSHYHLLQFEIGHISSHYYVYLTSWHRVPSYDVCTAEHNTRMIISSQSLMFQHNLITSLRLTCWANFNHDIRCKHIYLPLGSVRLDTIEFLTYLILTNCFVVIFCLEWSGLAWFTFPYCIPFLHLCYAFLLSILSISYITWVVTLLYNIISYCIY